MCFCTNKPSRGTDVTLFWPHSSYLTRWTPRLLHSLSLVAIGLSVVYETWPPIGWHHPFVIDLTNDRLGLPSTPVHYMLTWPVGIPIVFRTPVTVPLHCPNGSLVETAGSLLLSSKTSYCQIYMRLVWSYRSTNLHAYRQLCCRGAYYIWGWCHHLSRGFETCGYRTIRCISG